MNKYKVRYHKLINSIINKSFPQLKNSRLFVHEMRMKYLGFAFDMYFVGIIGLNPVLRSFSEKELRGILAHEIAHFERFRTRNFFQKVYYPIKYVFSKNFRRFEERETDKLAISKGYGNELLVMRKKSLKISSNKRIEEVKRNYLSPKEIMVSMKKIKKK